MQVESYPGTEPTAANMDAKGFGSEWLSTGVQGNPQRSQPACELEAVGQETLFFLSARVPHTC